MTVAGVAVEVNEEGFFEKPEQWTEDMVPILAGEIGLGELSEDHWKVIRYMRQSYLDTGSGPNVRALGRSSGVSVKELYQLFPKGPAKLAARLAGIPKPRGCV